MIIFWGQYLFPLIMGGFAVIVTKVKLRKRGF